MKRLITAAALLASLTSFAQKFEISELAGYSKNTSNSFFQNSRGPADRVSASYFLSHRLSVGAFYELNNWYPNTNGYGLTSDLHFGMFSLGLDISEIFFGIKKRTFQGMYISTGFAPPDPFTLTYRINPATSYGVHIGASQKLSKHFFLKEQLAYSYANSTGEYYGDYLSVKIHSPSLMAGIAYRQ